MRTYQHVIDSKAVKYTMSVIPDYWVVRDLTERDYGIDLMVEIFSKSGENKHGHPEYEATGWACYLQVKGTEKRLRKKRGFFEFTIEKKTLQYVERSPVPFLLVRVCTLEGNQQVFYCWLQRYIIEVLDKYEPDWRSAKPKTITVALPESNSLPANTKKIERIASRIKYIEEAAEFHELYHIMLPAFEQMIAGTLPPDLYDEFITDLKRISNLSTLLQLNDCQVAREDIIELIAFVTNIKNGTIHPVSIEDFPDPLMFNLDLLYNDHEMRMSLENMIAEHEGEVVF